MDEIEEIRKKRSQYLHRLFELTGGDEFKPLGMFELGEQLGFDKDLTLEIARYLSEEQLVRLGGSGGIRITHSGIKEVEDTLSPPQRLTEDLPSTNEHLTLFEQRLLKFFQDVGALHAKNILQRLEYNLPLMKRYPHIAAKEMHRFRRYLTESPSDNLPATFQTLLVIAHEVPELRDQIIKDMGDVLYEYKLLMPDLADPRTLQGLLTTLELPTSTWDSRIKSLARSLASLGRPAIVVVGAGFSYDTMPITMELRPLLVPVLQDEGVDNPMQLLQENDQEVWQIVKSRESDFKRRFAGWCAHSEPSFQHTMVCEMLHGGQVTHLISFNWDDLCERAYADRFGARIPKVTRDGVLPNQPTLWKLHGDVEHLDQEWVFPYERGRVFGTLIESLEQATKISSPAYALIVGYSEWEPEVKDSLIGWLEKNVPAVLRVRPNWPEHDEGGIPDSAKHFFQRLRIYMDLEGRGKSWSRVQQGA